MTNLRDAQKQAAAIRAVKEIDDGMVVGLGSGTTAACVVVALAARVSAGLRVQAIPTSRETAALAQRLGIPLTSFAAHQRLDLTIDGADQVELGSLTLIKGLGGALLHEKIVASVSARLIIVVDESKLVRRLSDQTALPVEIVSFGWQCVLARLNAIGVPAHVRLRDGKPVVTDSGNTIADCVIAAKDDAAALNARLTAIVGVVETGLFIGMADRIIVGRVGGVEVIDA